MAKVYTFHITYEGLEEKIWRRAAVSSNYRLDQLGYLVLAAFDTMAYHLFQFQIGDQLYEIPDEEEELEGEDMAEFKLDQLNLATGDRIRMEYDFGTMQTFWLELISIEDMKRGQGRKFPYLLDGAGAGIIDDLNNEEAAELIAQIDQNGETDVPVFYKERFYPWDYRKFDLKTANSLLKSDIEEIEEGYSYFWC